MSRLSVITAEDRWADLELYAEDLAAVTSAYDRMLETANRFDGQYEKARAEYRAAVDRRAAS